MNSNAAKTRDIAEILIASALIDGSIGSGALSVSISELRPGLLVFMGQGGFRALVTRGLFLVSRQFPELFDVKVNSDGSFSGLDEACTTLSDADVREASICFLSEALLLLLQFLGPGITLAVINDAWPGAPLGHVNLSQARKS